MKLPTTEPILVRRKQLAAMLSICPRTVDDMVARRLIPYVPVTRRLYLYDPIAVREALMGRFGVAAGEERAQ
ncbi:MAG TPA: hypothetical protein PLU30_22440 [Verrucomicrobiae bacterium]|nr:hypothetical protein [Verrucomicrobiae bacterium]